MGKKDWAIKVKNLNKTFKVREKGSRSIRDSILRFYQQKGDIREIEALKDINFEVKKGEFFGIIGRNGSGKSTLLRLLMGSFQANEGSIIKTNGKMIRLAMGLGFDGNLSARDNIYINGSVLGLSFKKIGSIFNEIIKFAELEDFVDTPVKHYSSGMQAKLKFSVARYAEADILLMDELFGGVGDIAFAHKSQKVFNESILAGKTIVLVSHSLNIIANNCSRVLLLDKGNQIKIGPPEEIIPRYEAMFEEELKERNEVKERRKEERRLLRQANRAERMALRKKEKEKQKIEKRKIWLESKKEKELNRKKKFELKQKEKKLGKSAAEEKILAQKEEIKRLRIELDKLRNKNSIYVKK